MKRGTSQVADKPSMVRGQLGVRVLGAQTQAADSPQAHTVYRTAVNYRGACYHRLIRYRDFLAFASKVKVLDGAPVSVAFPPRMWTRKASLRPEVVEARRVLIDEFMRQVCAKDLAPRTDERLLRLLQLGPYARHSEGGDRPSKTSDATLLLGDRRTLDVGRESAEASVAIMSLPVRDEDESGALRAAALQLASALPAVDLSEEEPAVSEMQQSSGELAAESDARGSFEDSRARRSTSLPPAPVLPITPIRCTPRSALRSSESLPPAHLRKMVDFADTPEADSGASGGGLPFADSGASSASSSPSPSSKYEGAVQLQRARISQLLQSGARLSSLPPGAETA